MSSFGGVFAALGKKADCHEAVCGYTVDVSPVTSVF